MLNSRFKNRIAYGGLGTIDLFKRTWKDLCDFITIEVRLHFSLLVTIASPLFQCDDVDITPTIQKFKFHCVLFLNIAFYSGGTTPWGSHEDGDEWLKPSSCDGKIEVLGFTTATLVS